MAVYKRFEDLPVWQNSKELAVVIYKISDKGRFKRDFSLRDQLRRCAVSISSNIAKGFERGSKQEFIQFLYIARGSRGELRLQLYIAEDAEYIDNDSFMGIYEQTQNVSRQINGFIEYLKKTTKVGQKHKQIRNL